MKFMSMCKDSVFLQIQQTFVEKYANSTLHFFRFLCQLSDFSEILEV